MPESPAAAKHKVGRGGNRKHPADCACGNCPQVGRRKNKAESTVADGDKNFATRVLGRIKKDGEWRKYSDVTKIESDEDYALHLLAGNHGADQFNKLLDRRFGKPVQNVNHMHDKPIELNVNVSLAERIQKGRQRVTKR